MALITKTVNDYPLKGLRVLDLTRVLAGPFATQMLADFGAEVIKIEKPHEGDETRGWGPPFTKNADGSESDAAYFHAANRGKKSVCIDISTKEGANLIKALALKSDILVENYKVGGLAKYGLDYEALHKLNSRLIYCSITGFGQTGPFANRAGYDFMIQGMAGVMSITGEPDGRPLKMGVAFADVFAGLHSVIGIQTALIAREKTGMGQHIDISLLDSQVSVLANQAMNYLISEKVPQRLGNEHPNIVPYQTFATSDGHIIIAAGNDRQFAALCKVIGATAIGADGRFTTNRGRVELRRELIPALAPYFTKRETSDWIAALEADAVPCGPINTINQVFADQHVRSRGLVTELTQHDGGKIKTVSNPLRFSDSQNGAKSASPTLGQDTVAVLQDLLGFSKVKTEALLKKGIVA